MPQNPSLIRIYMRGVVEMGGECTAQVTLNQTVDDYYGTISSAANVTYVAWPFSPNGYSPSKAEVKIKKQSGVDTTTMYGYIYDDISGHPGNLVSTADSTINVGAWSNNTLYTACFIFTGVASLNGSYWIVLKGLPVDADGDGFELQYQTGGTDITLKMSSDGSSWSDVGTAPYSLKVSSGSCTCP